MSMKIKPKMRMSSRCWQCSGSQLSVRPCINSIESSWWTVTSIVESFCFTKMLKILALHFIKVARQWCALMWWLLPVVCRLDAISIYVSVSPTGSLSTMFLCVLLRVQCLIKNSILIFICFVSIATRYLCPGCHAEQWSVVGELLTVGGHWVEIL